MNNNTTLMQDFSKNSQKIKYINKIIYKLIIKTLLYSMIFTQTKKKLIQKEKVNLLIYETILLVDFKKEKIKLKKRNYNYKIIIFFIQSIIISFLFKSKLFFFFFNKINKISKPSI